MTGATLMRLSRIKNLIGFVDGQTTNPSLIAKNPEIQRLIASGHKLSSQEEKEEYQKIVQSISPLVGDAGVSIEVFADLDTRAEEMLAQGRRNVLLDSKCLCKVSVHARGIASRTDVRTKEYSGQHYAVFFAETSGCRVCRDEGVKGSRFMYHHLSAGLTIAAKTAWSLSEISRKCTNAAMAMCMS